VVSEQVTELKGPCSTIIWPTPSCYLTLHRPFVNVVYSLHWHESIRPRRFLTCWTTIRCRTTELSRFKSLGHIGLHSSKWKAERCGSTSRWRPDLFVTFDLAHAKKSWFLLPCVWTYGVGGREDLYLFSDTPMKNAGINQRYATKAFWINFCSMFVYFHSHYWQIGLVH